MHRFTPGITLCLLLVTLITLTATSLVMAYPHNGELWELKQPDGSMVTVKVFGDEFYQVVESLDGYTLVRDEHTDIICYARVTADGFEFESTGVRLGTVAPGALGLQPHLRLNSEARYIKAKQMRDMGGIPMPGKWDPALAPPPSTGNVTGLVLIVDFSDVPWSIPQSDVVNFCNQNGYSQNGNNGSVKDYFSDVSDGLLQYSSFVLPAYHRASQPFSYYDDCGTPWLQRAKELIIEALTQLEADGHDFSVYDSNSDGYIDAINLFYAGNTACGWTKGMWPGSSGMQDAWSADGVATNRYQITGMGSSLSIGTYCHENGHMICGFPDLYDYDTGSNDSAGVGRWCLMAAQYGLNPQEPCGFLKIKAGWATPTVINADQPAIAIGPSSDNGNIYKFPSGNPAEYYLVENRRQTGRDALLPDSGLEFMHVDENGDHSWNQMLPDSHFTVTIVQADGDWDLENNNNNGDSTDLYAGPTYDALGVCTDPNTNWWSGTPSGFNFLNISPSSTNMLFDFTTGDDSPVAQCKSYGADADTDCCIDVAVADIDNGSYDPQGTGDIESILITAVDGNPVTPAGTVEVCGDGMHTVTLTITDLCGNSDACDADVEVENDTPVTLCKTYAAEADTACCILVAMEDIDNGSYDPDGSGDIKSFGITAIDGNPVALSDTVEVCGNGWHTVTLTMTDWCDSTSSCDADVEVIDVTPPWIVTSLNRDCLWPPNHKMVDILVDIEVTDNCDPDPYWELYSITSDEDDNGKGDGNTVGDIGDADLNTEDTAFQLRSERSGKGDGRTYTIIYRAEDESNNVAFDTSYVIVPHDMGHGAVCAFGFNVFGTGFESDARLFMVVIPSTEAVYETKGNRETLVKPAVVASEIDVTRAYVGNSVGAMRPVRSTVVDVTGDGLDDLALTYVVQSARVIPTGQWLSAADGLGEAATPGSLGLHFMGQDGTPYLVSDIFALGSPVDVRAEDKGGDVVEPKLDKGNEALDVTSEANVSFSNGIASIYPNPFNPATTVRFTLAADADVTIAVYDVSGALVRVLVDRNLSSGEHTAAWDGTDAQGQTVATGVYFARMLTGSFEMTRKMVLVK